MSFEIEIQNQIDYPNLPSKEELQLWIDTALQGRVNHGEICLRIVDDEEITALNSQFRHKNKPTNILSFPADLPEGLNLDCPPLGDLVISASVMEKEARKQRKPLIAHWCHIIIHGCLHLIGYDHIKAEEAKIMETIEIECLQQLGYPNPYGALPIS